MANVIVTGSNKGIGLATVLALARAGHKVYATMRNLDRGTALRDAIAKETLPIEIHAMDVSSDSSVEHAMTTIRARAGVIDALVNNAGAGRLGAIEDLSIEDFRTGMETNYLGALRCIRAVLPGMRDRRSGCVVNITSVLGRVAMAPFAMYAASKFAIEAMSEILAQEVKPFNIRIALVEPGIIDTGMARSVTMMQSQSVYPHVRRYNGFFAALLKNPVPPSAVADTIRGIIESGSWQLRYPVYAERLIAWRAGMTDEEWVESGSLDDEAWYRRVEQDLGLDARTK